MRIFGDGVKTATGVRIERSAAGRCRKSEVLFAAGGGTVPESSAILAGAGRQYHGALHMDQDVKKRLKVKLTG